MEQASTWGVQAAPLAAAGAATGADAFAKAVADARSGIEAPSLVFAFPSGTEAADVDVAAASHDAGAPVVGISGNGSIGSQGAIEEGCSALALSNAVSVGIGVSEHAGANLRSATRDAAGEALARLGENANSILLL